MRRFGRGSGLALSRYAEYEALAAVGSAYEAWVRANTRLDEEMAAAAAQDAAPPVGALQASGPDSRGQAAVAVIGHRNGLLLGIK